MIGRLLCRLGLHVWKPAPLCDTLLVAGHYQQLQRCSRPDCLIVRGRMRRR